MAGLRFSELQSRAIEFLDFTSVTLDEFQQLVPPFETAFQARMALRRMDGKPRAARRFTVYKNCPLPTPEDRLLYPVWGQNNYPQWSGTRPAILIAQWAWKAVRIHECFHVMLERPRKRKLQCLPRRVVALQQRLNTLPHAA
jgi:hypothetical protein